MQFCRQACLSAVLVCLCLSEPQVFGQQQPAPPKPEPAEAAPQTSPPRPQNPFETIPAATIDPPKPQLETPKPVGEPKADAPKPDQAKPAEISNAIEAINFRGSRRVPQDTLRALIFTKRGDPYSDETLSRDFMALWNTGRFDDIRLERERGETGWILHFVLQERRMVRTINYPGMKSITVSEILDRFKERRVGLQVESQYDPNRIQRAANVLREYLAERGRQYATVTPELRQVPPTSLEVNFRVDEGPKVKVGDIEIEGNNTFSDREVRRAMANTKPIGIPYSIFAENLFSRTFDSTKLEEDEDRIRMWYQQRGYFLARVVDDKVNIRDIGGGKFRVPLFYSNKPGKRADIGVTVEEGRLYHLGKVTFQGIKLFRTPEPLFEATFQMREGDIFSTDKLRKGLEQFRKMYGNYGYLDAVTEPDFAPDQNTGILNMTLAVDEGKQFFVRRIDFSGNSTTRDKVIRRELLINEGDLFSTQLWEVSLLRLNQLGYFEVLKENEAATIVRDTRNNTVDLTLNVKERGKNTVQLSGGVSAISGSFISFGYSTNNFLGMGETLSIDTQLGDRMRSATFGFTEPYFLDRPINAGFTLFYQRYNYNQGREVSLLSGRDLAPIYNAIGQQNLLNYVSNGAGFSLFASTMMKRQFARIGLSYNFNLSNIDTLTNAADNYFNYYNFQNLEGPNQLTGIRTTSLTPSYTVNTVDHPVTPSRGRSIYIGGTVAGSWLGGNVNMVEPSIDLKYFRAGFRRGHVIGMHFLGRFLTGYGGKAAPPFNRFYMGGENDIRGFDVWSISPLGYIPNETTIPVRNSDGSARFQKVIQNGKEVLAPVTQRIPTYQLTQIGGDTQGVYNLEYRIPIFGPVVLAGFVDIGLNRASLQSQLKLNPGRLTDLNSVFPQASFGNGVVLEDATMKPRMSTGLELQIMMPVVNAPFRLYWAYNPLRVSEFLQPPIVADRSFFPNQATFNGALAFYGTQIPYFEKPKVFRFTISRTF